MGVCSGERRIPGCGLVWDGSVGNGPVAPNRCLLMLPPHLFGSVGLGPVKG